MLFKHWLPVLVVVGIVMLFGSRCWSWWGS